MSTKSKEALFEKLKDKEYRDGFVEAHIDEGVRHQIRSLREMRGWTQSEVARKAGITQPRVSAIEDSDSSGLTLATLNKLASAFDVALLVRFAPFSELAEWVVTLSQESLQIPSFREDTGFLESSQFSELAIANVVESFDINDEVQPYGCLSEATTTASPIAVAV